MKQDKSHIAKSNHVSYVRHQDLTPGTYYLDIDGKKSGPYFKLHNERPYDNIPKHVLFDMLYLEDWTDVDTSYHEYKGNINTYVINRVSNKKIATYVKVDLFVILKVDAGMYFKGFIDKDFIGLTYDVRNMIIYHNMVEAETDLNIIKGLSDNEYKIVDIASEDI